MSSSEGVANNEVSTMNNGVSENGAPEFIENNTLETDENNTNNEVFEFSSIIAELKTTDALRGPPADSPSSVTSEQKMPPSREDMAEATNLNFKSKYATKDIYRPPSLRSGDGASPSATKSTLNVHAREFVMGTEKKTKKDDVNDLSFSPKMDAKPLIYPLNISKSSASVFGDSKFTSSQLKSNDERPKVLYELQRGKSSGNIGLSLENHFTGAKISNVHFKSIVNGDRGDSTYPETTSPLKKVFSESFNGSSKRLSKNLSTTDPFKFETPSVTRTFTQYDYFPAKLHRLIRNAVEDPNQVEDKSKVALGRKMVELVADDRELASPAAKLSVIIMDKDKSGAYYDSLVNTCQFFYQSKKISSDSNSAKFAAFLTFLIEFHSELKRRASQLRMSESITQSELTFLILISRCCVDLVVSSSVTEVECLFSTLTKVGREIENEAPIMFKRLFDTIREVLLTGQSVPKVRKVLLQLIELRAFEWQLPLSALNFYYPKVLV